MNEFDILRSASAGMDAQRSALDLAARNVAAAEATSDGQAFERLVPRFAVGAAPGADATGIEPGDDVGDPDLAGDGEGDATSVPIRYLGATPQRGVEVDAVTEMVAVLDAQRAYEANASVFDLGKRLAERTIDMGRLS
jgi:flagellar basal-body rod protein FlgC